MKKISKWLISLIYIFALTVVNLYAYVPGDVISIPVLGTCVNYDGPEVYQAELLENSFSLVTDEGIQVTVTGENFNPDDNWKLVIHEILPAEEEPYKWISGCTKNYGENIRAFYIYFSNKSGSELDPPGNITIKIGLADTYNVNFVGTVSTLGETSPLNFEKSGKNVVFNTSSKGYYTVLEKTPEKLPDEKEPEKEKAPEKTIKEPAKKQSVHICKTADRRPIGLWTVIAIASFAVYLLTLITEPKGKYSK